MGHLPTQAKAREFTENFELDGNLDRLSQAMRHAFDVFTFRVVERDRWLFPRGKGCPERPVHRPAEETIGRLRRIVRPGATDECSGTRLKERL
jgi:hypothetical protein